MGVGHAGSFQECKHAWKFLLAVLVLVSQGTAVSADAAAIGDREPKEDLHDQHSVHLRTGILLLNEISISASRGAPAAQRRALLMQQSKGQYASGTSGDASTVASNNRVHELHTDRLWGPLAELAPYLLSLGPDMQHGGAQQQLLDELHARGILVSSFLPPFVLVVLAPSTQLEWLSSLEGVELAAYPPDHKIAPEWQPVIELLQDPDAARQLASGTPVAQLLKQQRQRQQQQQQQQQSSSSGDVAGVTEGYLGALRPHSPSTASNASSASGAGARPRSPLDPMFLIHVQFASVEQRDLERLGLTLPDLPPHEEPGANSARSGRKRAAARVFNPAVGAVVEWPAALAAVASECGVDVFEEHGSLLVAACAKDLPAVLSWLSRQPSVRWLSPRMASRLHNIYASAIVQMGAMTSAQDPRSIGLHPIWQAGLNGTGQVIGSGDSGIDMDSCYFWDGAVPFRTSKVNGVAVFSSTTHRKVRLYYGLRDTVDGFGHGTHTSGTLVGSVYGADAVKQPDMATGMAPYAKVSFMDLSDGSGDTVWTPSDLSLTYYPRSYGVGARLHSDSWGSDATAYDSLCQSVDRFTWNNKDFLPVFAAGNFGGESGYASTITSPAVSKNSLAVGASLGLETSYRPQTTVTVYQITLSVAIGGAGALQRSDRIVQASFGGNLGSLKPKGALPLVGASPADACSGLNSRSVSARVVVVQRGNCSLSDKLRNAQSAGASALIITNDRQEGYFVLAPNSLADAVGLSTPMGGVPLSFGRYLWSAADSGTATVTFSDATTGTASFENVASFSSFGPTQDGRIKPDIVAPGVLRSALSDGSLTGVESCSSTVLQGTSMAAPVVAGSAALVRQYFTDGFYPTGTATPANKYASPSGVLVKAVLLAGAIAMKGNVEHDGNVLPLEAPPSYRQGFGRADLTAALPLPGSTLGWRMQVVDGAALMQGGVDRYCVHASGGPLKVVLAWFDPPGDPAAATPLVNNLDLEVRAGGMAGQSLLGNGFNDTLNNVEAVILPDDLAEGNVAITVRATRVLASYSPQSYALVVLGKFSGTLQSPYNPVGATSNTSGACVVTVAAIDDALSSGLLTRNRDVVFYFGTQSGSSPAAGFECKLTTQSGAYGVGLLHNWRSCSSPASYPGMADGAYVFQVRAAGEDVADVRTFTVDSTPPVTSLTSTLSNGATTSTDNATITFSASDASPVRYTCYVSVSNGPTPINFRSTGGQLQLGKSVACTSPIKIEGLYYGDWTLTVRGLDAAGNVEIAGPVLTWQVRYTPASAYTRLASAPPALYTNQTLTFKMYSFTGTTGLPLALPNTTQLQWQLYLQSAQPPTTWSTTSSATVTTKVPSGDGTYVFSARVANASVRGTDSAATAVVTVDTTPPVLVIMERPNAVQSSTSVTIKFASVPADDAIQFYCRWLQSASSSPSRTTSDAGATAFGACQGPSPTSATGTVTDGYWLFQVKAVDAAGNMSPPSDVAFYTDTQPPAVTSITYPAASRSNTATITYKVDDGLLGSGLSNVTCTMTATYLQPNASVAVVNAVVAAMYKVPTGLLEAPCPSPARYLLQEGKYVFSLYAVDNAGLRTQADYTIYMDTTPPVTRVTTTAQPLGSAVPSTARLEFMGRDQPDGEGSGVVRSECQLSATSALTATTNTSSSSTSGRRRLHQATNSTTPTAPTTSTTPPRLNGTDVALGGWYNCSSPAEYSRMASGWYAFKVRSVDAAGNSGSASDTYTFRVDDTLPLDGGATTTTVGGDSGGFQTNKLVIGVVAGVGGLLLIGVVIGIFVVRRRMARDHYLSNITLPPPPPHFVVAGGGGVPPPHGNYPHGPPNGHLVYYHNAVGVQGAVGPGGGAVISMTMRSAGGGSSAGGAPPGGDRALFSTVQGLAHDAEVRRQWEEERVRQAIQASIEEEQVRRALAASRQEDLKAKDDERLQAAIRESLNLNTSAAAAAPAAPSPAPPSAPSQPPAASLL